MRKAQKAQLLEILQTLQEAHKEIKKHISRCEMEMAYALLGECQQSAVQIGELIEASEGEDCPAVRALEDYCEELYQVSQSIPDKNFAKKAAARMHKALARVEDCVRTGIPVRTEVVFFPYKASMFDSLESVWRAADADPDCDAYVVPIPYYEVNSDGSLGKLCYEGGEYPSYVPVIDWMTYDLEKRHPDVAFIHNPYDNQNRLTQVHPAYFSGNLKKYVGILCYIPYFATLGEVSPHFAYLPAVLNSDFTIVESEEVRQQYLAVWEKLVQQGNANAGAYEIIKNRIMALGSPKFDAVGASGNVELPKEWEQLTLKADGTRKKVVFYNTSISGVLTNTLDAEGNITDRYLKKLESVLNYFRNRNDTVLLWRPHPLLEQTFASMRPQLYERYLRNVREYQNEGYGIYDNSPNLHRAIEISDVYYGDGSSVVALWEKSGKPFLIENSYATFYERRLRFASFYFNGMCFWCTASDFNGLFRIEKDTLKVHYAGRFAHEEDEGLYLYLAVAEREEKLYFAPYNARSIGIYDKQKQKFSSIPLKGNDMYTNAFTYGKYVFMTGARFPRIMRIDTQTNDVLVIDAGEKQIFSHEKGRQFDIEICSCQIGKKLFLPCGEADAMLIFDMCDLSSWVYRFPEHKRMYNRSIAVGDQVWLCSASSPFIGVYDNKSGQLIEFANRFQFNGFTNLTIYQQSVLCLSTVRNKILKIDIRTHQMEQIAISETCFSAEQIGDYLYYLPYHSGTLNVLDFRTMEQCTEKLLCPDEMPAVNIKKVIEASKSNYGYCYESCYLNFDVFLGAAEETERESTASENCGETIYQYIKKRIT